MCIVNFTIKHILKPIQLEFEQPNSAHPLITTSLQFLGPACAHVV